MVQYRLVAAITSSTVKSDYCCNHGVAGSSHDNNRKKEQYRSVILDAPISWMTDKHAMQVIAREKTMEIKRGEITRVKERLIY